MTRSCRAGWCRQEILQTYAQQLSGDDLEKLAAATPGMSGRDLRDVAEQAERRWASKARHAILTTAMMP